MASEMNVKDTAARAVQLAGQLGAEAVEAYVSNSKELVIDVRNGAVETMKQAEDSGLGVRVFSHSRMGFAFTTELGAAAVEETIRQAMANARLTEPDPHRSLPHPAPCYPQPQIYDPAIGDKSVEDKIAMAKEMERRALARDDRVRIIESATYQDGAAEVALVNSKGLDVYSRGAYCGLYLALVAGSGEDSQTGFALDYSLQIAALDPGRLGELAADRAVRMLGAALGPTGQAAVVLDPYVAAGFLGVLAPALSAEAVQKGRSLFAGRVGQRVASDAVCLVDDGAMANGLASAPFDGEGVPSAETVLIREGVLQGFLHNTYTAAKEGTLSTGNGVRGSFKGAPEVGPTNFFLQPGAQTPEQIIGGLDSGLYVTEVMGLHTANPISGDFSFGVSGLWIEKGQLVKPVRGMAVAGNIIDLIKNIDAVGNDLQFFGGRGAPTVRIARLSISGQ